MDAPDWETSSTRNPPLLPLPDGWEKLVRIAVVHAVALAHHGMTAVRGWAINSRITRVRLQAELDRAMTEIGLLTEENRILRSRIERIAPRERPHYAPTERMAILQLKAARGWSLAVAAARFLVTAATLASWTKRAEDDASELVKIPVPANKFPEVVAYVTQTLKVLVPGMGAVRVVQQLARAGLHISASTARRFVRREKIAPPPEPPSANEPPAKARA